MVETSTKLRPKVAAFLPSLIASCQINVIKPLKAAEKRGLIDLKISLEGRSSLDTVHWADVVVFCRNTEPAYAHLLNEAVASHKPVIFDLDDNFWDVPFETDPVLARYHRLPLRIQQLERYLTHSNLIRVYSPEMIDVVRRLNSNLAVTKAGFDFSLLEKEPKSSCEVRPCNGRKVRIVYATSRIVDDQYLLFLEGLQKALNEFGDRIEVTIWGCQPAELAEHRSVKLLPLVSTYDGFLREFSKSGFDIGLAPLSDTQFNRSKTNTKYRDYGACRVAGIYSDVAVYNSCVKDGVTGLLVKNEPESWFCAIERLVNDQQLREQVKEQAYRDVYEEFRQELVEDEWVRQIRGLLSTNTDYSVQAALNRQERLVRIRADFMNFCGIKIPSFSPEEGEELGKLFMEVLSPEQNILRQCTGMECFREECPGEIVFSFNPIRNSAQQEFLLRFVGLTDEKAESEMGSWLPSNAYVQMLYSGGVRA